MLVIIYRGIPGSGKSTQAALFHKLVPNSVLVSADIYMRAGGKPFEWQRLERCHNQCRSDYLKALSEKVPLVIVDNTNTKFSDLTWYVATATSANYKFVVYQLHVPPQVALERGTHEVPLKTLELMAARMWHERMPSTWQVFDSGRPWRPPTQSEKT